MSNLALSRWLWRCAFPRCSPVAFSLLSRYQRMKVSFVLYFATPEPPMFHSTMKRGGEGQSFREKLFLPQVLRKWKPRWEQVFQSTLLSLYLWRTLLGHEWIRTRILLSLCWLVYLIPKESSFSKRVSRMWHTFLG